MPNKSFMKRIIPEARQWQGIACLVDLVASPVGISSVKCIFNSGIGHTGGSQNAEGGKGIPEVIVRYNDIDCKLFKEQEMKFDKAVPILYSSDVSKSISYFIEHLKFENKWEWGNPVNFGGIYRDQVEIFFSKAEGKIPVQWFAIVVDNVDEYYASIKNTEAKIIATPGTKEWNMREMIIECPDGHMLRIGHNTACD